MNTIQLERSIRVQTFDAHATIAIGAERPEWLAIARLAKDFGGEIRAEQITTELLHGVPPVVGRRVIERCASLGLLEQNDQERKAGIARLSRLGEKAVTCEQVFVPEERTWRFYFAEDPLLQQALLHIEPLDDGSAKDERDELRKQKQAGQRATDDDENCPKCLVEARISADVLSSVAEAGPSFVLTSISDAGATGDHMPLHLQLTWKSGHRPELFLTGQMARPVRRARGKDQEARVHPEPPLTVGRPLEIPQLLSVANHEQVWMALAASGTDLNVELLESWRQRTGRLVFPVSFAGRKPAALKSFREDVSVPAIPDGGLAEMEWLEGFVPSELPGAELVPASEPDAQQWAEWLLRETLNHYATPDGLKESADAIRLRFAFHSPSLPTPDEMLKAALAKPSGSQSRFILAPYDLGLWR